MIGFVAGFSKKISYDFSIFFVEKFIISFHKKAIFFLDESLCTIFEK